VLKTLTQQMQGSSGMLRSEARLQPREAFLARAKPSIDTAQKPLL
jgi:hypothetical protein